jgi:hypothetical protein
MNPAKTPRKTWTRREASPANTRLAHVVKSRRAQLGEGDIFWGNRPEDTLAFLNQFESAPGNGTYRCIESGVRKNYSEHTLASVDYMLQLPEGTCKSVLAGGANPDEVLKFPLGSQDVTIKKAFEGVRAAKTAAKKEAEAKKEAKKAEEYDVQLGIAELNCAAQAAEMIAALPTEESRERVLNQLWATFGYE